MPRKRTVLEHHPGMSEEDIKKFAQKLAASDAAVQEEEDRRREEMEKVQAEYQASPIKPLQDRLLAIEAQVTDQETRIMQANIYLRQILEHYGIEPLEMMTNEESASEVG